MSKVSSSPPKPIHSFLKTPQIRGPNLKPETVRKNIIEYFNQGFDIYESLFAQLKSPEAYMQRPQSLRHKLIFYWGHTAVFFINKLFLAGIIKQRINPQMEIMLSIGVDEMSWDDLLVDNNDWPSGKKVGEYRNKVRKLINDWMNTNPISLPITTDSDWWIILMGCEHERIHIETSAVLFRELDLNWINPNPLWEPCPRSSTSDFPKNQLIPVEPQAKITLGRSPKSTIYYGWDNEFGTYSEEISPFSSSKYLVSNGEFLEFVNDNGYNTKSFWTSEGQAWIKSKKPQFPVYWIQQSDGSFKYRTMTRIIDLPLDWPVDVNYLEAKAFCNWKSKKSGKSIRLPTEAEWHAFYRFVFDSLDSTGIIQHNANVHFDYWASHTPVNFFPPVKGFSDVVGNSWQWTETPIFPFLGFQVHPAYDDFTVPTYDNRHNIFKGGTWAATGNEALVDSRYAFRRHFFQYAGFRYIETSTPPTLPPEKYDLQDDVQIPTQLHYSSEKNYLVDIANLVIKAAKDYKINPQYCFDIGCSVGRSSFQLATHFNKVLGVDFTARLISMAYSFQAGRQIEASQVIEGEITRPIAKLLNPSIYSKVTRDKCKFLQGDACNLRPDWDGFTCALASNVLSCLPNPRKFLVDIKSRILPGGLLVIASAYDWNPDITPKSKWIGGYKDSNGDEITPLASLKKILGPEFTLKSTSELECRIQLSTRKSLTISPQVSIWQKSV